MASSSPDLKSVPKEYSFNQYSRSGSDSCWSFVSPPCHLTTVVAGLSSNASSSCGEWVVNELAAKFVVTGKVMSDHIIGDREEALIWALGALDPRLFADAPDPFVPAHWGITGLACLSTLEPARVDIFSSAKQ